MAGPEPAPDLPLVSVVTPSLNQARFIDAAILSVLAQDYPRIEHIVVDGASIDGTIDVLRAYDHLRWISESDRGQSHALNKGFELARGEIFGWLNADDVYLPGAVISAVTALREGDYALVYGGWKKLDADGNVVRDVSPMPWDYRAQLEIRNGISQPAAFFTRDAFVEVGGVDEGYRYAMDYELWLKLGKEHSVRCIDRPLAGFRTHPGSKSVAEAEGFSDETWRAARSHGARLRSSLFVDYYLPRRHPWMFRAVLGWRHVRRGDVRGLLGRAASHVERRAS